MTYEEELERLCAVNQDIVVMTAENRAAIRSLPGKLGKRFVDVGIAEQTLVGAAAGLALRGRLPVVHALATFLTMRACEFIRTDIGIGHLPVKLVGAFPGFLSTGNGPTHQAIEDVALMRSIPSMQIICPADRDELVQGLAHVLASPHPCYVRFNDRPPVMQHTTPFKLGRSEVISDGFDVTILTYGFLLEQAAIATDFLEKEGISVRLINLRTLSPIDETRILEAARESALLVTLEDHSLTGGLFTIVSELLVRFRMAPAVYPVALKNHWFTPGLLNDVLGNEGFTGELLAERIRAKLLLLHTSPRHLVLDEAMLTPIVLL